MKTSDLLKKLSQVLILSVGFAIVTSSITTAFARPHACSKDTIRVLDANGQLKGCISKG